MEERDCLNLLAENKEKFDLFENLLLDNNKKFNLTALTDHKDVFYKHFYDSVIAADFFFEGADVIEIGSGGGFPSVPLMIARRDLCFTLLESNSKKCAYLDNAVDKLGLNCKKVLNLRAEEGGKDFKFREKFDISCARAVANLSVLSEYCLPYVKVGGKFIAYKGENVEEIKEAENIIKLLGGKIKEVYPYSLPENYGKRNIVVIEKISPTPEKYPRKNSQIVKKK